MQDETIIVDLIWSDPIPFSSAKEFVDDTIDFGIYQIYGTHPVHGNGVLLYVGRAKNGSFGWRIPQHKGWLDNEGVSESYVRLGRLSGVTTPSNTVWEWHIELAESLLIFSHIPPCNTKVNLGSLDLALESVYVCNWGARGAILPEVSGLRWTSKAEARPKNIFRVGSGNDPLPPTEHV